VIFAAITLRVASQRAIAKVGVYFVIDSVRRLLEAPSQLFEVGHDPFLNLSSLPFIIVSFENKCYTALLHNLRTKDFCLDMFIVGCSCPMICILKVVGTNSGRGPAVMTIFSVLFRSSSRKKKVLE